MKELKESPRASVRVSFDGRKIYKTYKGRLAEERFHNELKILRFLERRGCDFVPRALEADEDELTLVMSHCGQPVKTMSQEKMDKIYDELEKNGVRHGDQAVRNITYDAHRGRFCVIDFEFATLVEPTDHLERTWSRLQWSGLTDCGPFRKQNDDTFVAFSLTEEGYQHLPNQGEAEIEKGDVVFVVSDGMGGASSGDLASELIVGRLREIIPRTYQLAANQFYPDRLNALADCLQDVHRAVTKIGDRKPHLAGMGATVTLCWFTPENVYYGHVGDTRLYRYRNQSLELITEDDTRVFAAHKRGEINEREFRTHPRRHLLKQAIGAGVQTIDPQLGSLPLDRNDWFLLCSDGLVGGLWQKHFERAFKEHTDSPETLTQHLFETSIAADGKDNVSLASIRLV